MNVITPELRNKFLRFHEVYEIAKAMLRDEGASGSVIASRVWEVAKKDVTLTADELRIYKLHVALQSVNGGELFGDEDPGDSAVDQFEIQR
ncbi:MAG: hypothetical protein ABIU09_05510 [Pyrinomonadaceae bacterium]